MKEKQWEYFLSSWLLMESIFTTYYQLSTDSTREEEKVSALLIGFLGLIKWYIVSRDHIMIVIERKEKLALWQKKLPKSIVICGVEKDVILKASKISKSAMQVT